MNSSIAIRKSNNPNKKHLHSCEMQVLSLRFYLSIIFGIVFGISMGTENCPVATPSLRRIADAVKGPNLAELLCLLHKFCDPARGFHMEAHLEILVIGTVGINWVLQELSEYNASLEMVNQDTYINATKSVVPDRKSEFCIKLSLVMP